MKPELKEIIEQELIKKQELTNRIEPRFPALWIAEQAQPEHVISYVMDYIWFDELPTRYGRATVKDLYLGECDGK